MSLFLPLREHGPEYHRLVGWYVGWRFKEDDRVHSMVVYVPGFPKGNQNVELAYAIARAYEIMAILKQDLDKWILENHPQDGITYRGHNDIQMYHRSEGFV